MFGQRRDPAHPPAEFFSERLRRLVREPLEGLGEGASPPDPAQLPDAMALLVELRGAARRRSEPVLSDSLGPEIKRHVQDFYELDVDQQMPCLEALVESRRHELSNELGEALAACERGLAVASDFPPLLARAAALHRLRGESAKAETCAVKLLESLDHRGRQSVVLQISEELVEQGIEDLVLLEACARRLETGGNHTLAARVWHEAAGRLLRDGRYLDALTEIDRALALEPDNPIFHLDLADVYERLNEPDQVAEAYSRAEKLANGNPDVLCRVLLARARHERPDAATVATLMDLLQTSARSRAAALKMCEEAVTSAPFNPHLLYVHGVFLAFDSQTSGGQAALKTAAERYSALNDRGGEMEARRALQELNPRDLGNRHRIAELLFELGEVKGAMEALAALARLARREGLSALDEATFVLRPAHYVSASDN